MGALEGTYAGATGGPATWAALGGLGVVASLFFAINAPDWLFAAGACLVICLATTVAAASRSKARVDVFDRGLIVRRGNETDAFSYDDVKNVWYRGRKTASGATTSSRFRLELNSGRQVGIEATTFKNSQRLATTLFRDLTANLTTRAKLDLLAGKRLSFGTIQVDRAGISNGRETIPWSEVRDVRVNSGSVTINRQGKWLSWAQVSTENTPNVLVLLMIADAIKGARIP